MCDLVVAGVGRPSARDNISSLWPVERAVSLSISPALPADKSWTSREGLNNILLSPVFIFQCQMGMKTTGVSLCPKKKKYPSLPFPWTWTSPVSRPLSSTPTTRCTPAFIKTSQLNKIEPHYLRRLYSTYLQSFQYWPPIVMSTLSPKWFPQVVFYPSCRGPQSTALEETSPVRLINLWPQYVSTKSCNLTVS